VLDQIPGGVERLVIVEQADPQSGQSADAAPAAAVRSAHFEEALEPDFWKGSREMIDPVAQPRLLARQLRQRALEERGKTLAGDVDVLSVAVDEVHWDIESVVAVALVAEPVFEHERQHAGAVRVGVLPDVAAETLVAVRSTFRERRVGEEGRGNRLQRETDPKLLHHVGF
jgi:hypothetical protein